VRFQGSDGAGGGQGGGHGVSAGHLKCTILW
jgi:hypothetical protein